MINVTEHSDLKQNPIWQGSDIGPMVMVRQTLGSSCFNDLYSDSILQPLTAHYCQEATQVDSAWLVWVSQHKALVFYVRDVTSWTLYTPRPFLRCILDPIYSEQLIAPVYWPLYNTLLWSAPGFQHYLFLHIIALSRLYTTLQTNYPHSQPRGGNPTEVFTHSKLIISLPENTSIQRKNGESAPQLRFVGRYFVTIWELPHQFEENEFDQLLELQLCQGRQCSRYQRHQHRQAEVLSFSPFAQIYQDVSEKTTLCGNTFGKRRWR